MAGYKVALATLKSQSVVKKMCIGTVLGLACGLWKMYQWNNEQWKVRAFYGMLDKGKTSAAAED